ncbi:ribosomal-protein-alanine acetyltransferase [Sphingomonas oleivorans]|uniref:Ribosomal-protein-alanine acetyltransferase n=1 Tax=Sphingomonas oleivorans TaxID=1735121 RepID=A0A2T5FY57_9SPHN|nr:GNAT family N-acetyltransferase [Sphingomonas oleivorans]PTQ11446.1 ribosomal-protein-alanine acetyltransferase [Sphingomonas oleivorans]
MSIALREGGIRDVEEMMITMDEAFDAAFGEAWTKPQCQGLMTLPGVWVTLATVDGEPAGFALNRVICDEAELLLLGVRPAYQGRGIGRALLERSRELARQQGAERLHLEVRHGNKALFLYQSAGFSEVGRRRGYYRGRDGQLFDALTLASSLLIDDRYTFHRK